jgi:hypothetical protein
MKSYKSLVLVAACLAAVINVPLWAQEPTCPLAQVKLTEKLDLQAPKGFDQLAFFDAKNKKSVPIGDVHAAAGGQAVTVDAATIAQARDLKKQSAAADQVQLRWGKKADATAECLQPFDVAPPATSSGGDAGAANGSGDASKAPELEVTALTLPPKPATTTLEKKDEEARQAGRLARLGDAIVLKTSADLGKYLDYATGHNKTVTLFLDGNDTGISAEAIDRKAFTLQFHLERNDDNKRVWATLLRDPFRHQTREVRASVGFAGGVAVPASAPTFTLQVVNWSWYSLLWLALLICLLVALWWLAVKHNLLRDGPSPCPYSLGRSQMAWWFVLIISGYVMIWLISGDHDTITSSLVALMGISSGTALGAVLIESTSGSGALSQAATDRLALQAAQQNAQQNVATAQKAVDVAPADAVAQKQLADAQAALAVANAKLLAVNNQLNGIVAAPKTRGFLRDILSDSNGTVGLHRFQIVVWTIVLGIIFLVSVVTQLSMPEFSATLLATMGISSGTYLGFKFPEK